MLFVTYLIHSLRSLTDRQTILEALCCGPIIRFFISELCVDGIGLRSFLQIDAFASLTSPDLA